VTIYFIIVFLKAGFTGYPFFLFFLQSFQFLEHSFEDMLSLRKREVI